MIFIGADHRGFEFKNMLRDWLKESGFDVTDCGAYEYIATDDYPDFAQAVAQGVLKNEENRGIVMCGSGVGVSVAANRFTGIQCALAFNIEQIQSATEHDFVNVISLPTDHITLEYAKELISIFLTTKQKDDEKYLRRLKKINKG